MSRDTKNMILFGVMTLLVAVMLIVNACSGTNTPEPVGADGDSDPPTPLSYLLKTSQKRWQMEQGIGAWALECAYGATPGSDWSDHDWRVDNQAFTRYTAVDRANPLMRVEFGYLGFDPLKSAWTYGDTKVLSQDDAEAVGSAYLIDDTTGVSDVDFTRDETVTEHQERSTSTGTEITNDLTAGVKGTVGGDGIGASLEVSVEAHLGIKTDKTTAEAESKDRSVTVHLATVVVVGTAELVTVNQANVQSQTPFTIDGIWDASIAVSWRDSNVWAGRPCLAAIADTDNTASSGGYTTITWDDWDDFLTMLAGENVEWPSAGPHNVAVDAHAEGVAAADWARRIRMTGIQKRSYQDSSEVRYQEVTGQDLDDLIAKHGIDDDHHITSHSQEATP